MKKTMRVIARGQLPSRLPIWSTMTLYLFLDRFHAPALFFTIAAIVMSIVWIASVYWMLAETPTELRELGERRGATRVPEDLQ